MTKRKIHIFYRHYNDLSNNKNRPSWFNYEFCFQNLLQSIENKDKVTLTIIYDNTNGGNNFIHRDFDGNEFELVEFTGGSDWASFVKTGEIIDSKNIPSTDLIYILENDYLHMEGWDTKVLELFDTYSNLDYVTLYDHNDKYFLPDYENLVSKIITTDSHHWRTTPSTCASFIIEKSLFDADKDILFTMPGDHNKFLWLNKNRARYVLSALPGLNTHVMNGLMSPGIQWELVNKTF